MVGDFGGGIDGDLLKGYLRLSESDIRCCNSFEGMRCEEKELSMASRSRGIEGGVSDRPKVLLSEFTLVSAEYVMAFGQGQRGWEW